MAPDVAQDLLAELRKRLKQLKKEAGLDDTAIAASMNELAPHVVAYQQKVSDFFSGEMKRPTLDFMAAVCSALGQTLPDLLATIMARTAPIHLGPDWEWLMFGRRIGPSGREAAMAFGDGHAAPAAAPAASRPRRGAPKARAGG